MDKEVRLICEGQLAVVMQQNEKQRAIVTMQRGSMFLKVKENIQQQVCAQLIGTTRRGLAMSEIVKVCRLRQSAINCNLT